MIQTSIMTISTGPIARHPDSSELSDRFSLLHALQRWENEGGAVPGHATRHVLFRGYATLTNQGGRDPAVG
jgi:hypothetical protein